MPNRSARTGRYISNAAAARHPGTTVREARAESFDYHSPPQRIDRALHHRRHRQMEPRWHGHRERLTKLHALDRWWDSLTNGTQSGEVRSTTC